MSSDAEVFIVGGPDVAWRETGGDIVILDLAGAVYFGLNATGAQLWKRLLDGASRADLLELLSLKAGRDSTPDTNALLADIDVFLAELDGYGLLRRVST